MAKGEISRQRKKRNERDNRETIAGKLALYQTYVDMGLDQSEAAVECMRNIQKQRNYLKARTGDDD